MIRRVQARREEGRRVASGGTTTHPNQQADQGPTVDHDNAIQNLHDHQEGFSSDHRPIKRVKKEGSQ